MPRGSFVGRTAPTLRRWPITRERRVRQTRATAAAGSAALQFPSHADREAATAHTSSLALAGASYTQMRRARCHSMSKWHLAWGLETAATHGPNTQ